MDVFAAAETSGPTGAEFRVICLCAEWCGTCREYREVFAMMGEEFPEIFFRWLDIEDEAEIVGDLDIENFPMLLISRKGFVLFFGTILPRPSHLRHLLQMFGRQSLADSQKYAISSPDLHAWRDDADLQRLCNIPESMLKPA